MYRLGFVVLALSIGLVTGADTSDNSDQIKEAETKLLSRIYEYIPLYRRLNFIKGYLNDPSTFHTLELHKYYFIELTFMAKKIYDTKYEKKLINRIDLLRLALYEPLAQELEELERAATCQKNLFFRLDNSLYTENLFDEDIYSDWEKISSWDLNCLNESIKMDRRNKKEFPSKRRFFEFIRNPNQFAFAKPQQSAEQKEILIAEQDLMTNLQSKLGWSWYDNIKIQYISEFKYFDIKACTFYELTYMAKLIYDTEFEKGLIKKIDSFRLKNYINNPDIIMLEKKATCRKNMFYRMDNSLYTSDLVDFRINPQLEHISSWDWYCLNQSIIKDRENGIHNRNKDIFSHIIQNLIKDPLHHELQMLTLAPTMSHLITSPEPPENKFDLSIFLNKYKIQIGVSIALIALIIFSAVLASIVRLMKVVKHDSTIKYVTTSESKIVWDQSLKNTNALYYMIGACVFGSIILLLVAIYLFKSNEKSKKQSNKEKSKKYYNNKTHLKSSSVIRRNQNSRVYDW